MPVEVSKMQAMVAAVKQHAADNYNADGWDYVIETMSDADIREQIGSTYTVNGAIRKVHALVKLWDERRKDVQSTAW